MGNTQSNILERLDDIASDYILEADYKTLKKMKDKEYCDKVTIVTKEILEKQFSHLDIEYLAKRTNNGWAWETLFKSTTQNPDDNTIKYSTNESVGYIRKINNPNKAEMCLSISKFYVKIGHIFSAIVGTIKPKYTFSNGEKYSILTPKKELPQGEKPFQLSENGFCYKRIESLKFGTDKNTSSINPQFCNANRKYSSANDIPGVPEFEMLYYDSTDERGTPMMSDKSLSIYRKDLTTFYKRFTDEEVLPNEIHKFSDIQLKQYNSSERCLNNKYNQPIQPIGNSRENSLFEDYALNLREMIQVTGDLQQNLVEILNKIFTKKKEGEKTKITINPNLTVSNIDKLIVETRNKLLELYLRCEEYFENGVNIYKAIVNDRIINNTFEELNREQETPYNSMMEPEQELKTPDIETEEHGEEEEQGEEEEEEEHVFADDEYPQESLHEQERQENNQNYEDIPSEQPQQEQPQPELQPQQEPGMMPPQPEPQPQEQPQQEPVMIPPPQPEPQPQEQPQQEPVMIPPPQPQPQQQQQQQQPQPQPQPQPQQQPQQQQQPPQGLP
jgi:hypothetical protein